MLSAYRMTFSGLPMNKFLPFIYFSIPPRELGTDRLEEMKGFVEVGEIRTLNLRLWVVKRVTPSMCRVPDHESLPGKAIHNSTSMSRGFNYL